MELSQRAQALPASPTLAISARAAELRRAGERVFSLAAGQPDFPTPEHIRRAAAAAMEAGHTGYAPSAGVPELRAAIRRYAAERLGVEYADDQVVVGCGAKQCLANAFLALLDPGQRALLQATYWVSYPAQVRLCGAEPLVAPAPEQGLLDLAAIRRGLEGGARLVVLNSPSNPSGQVAGTEEIDALAGLLREFDCYLVSDDIYERIVFTPEPCPHLLRRHPDLAGRVIVVNGVSKSYSMTGWRLGWALGPAPVIGAMRRLQDQTTSNAVTFVQHAAVAALESEPEVVDAMVRQFSRRLDLVCRLLDDIAGIDYRRPQGAFYLMLDVHRLLGRSWRGRAVDSAARLAEILLDSQRVAVVPGEAFGAPGFLRISIAAAREDLEQAVARLGRLVEELD